MSKTLEVAVETVQTVTSVTPYAASKTVNARLLADGIDKVLPAQMFYNYTTARTRKGKASLIAIDADGKITVEGLDEWYAKYTAKLVARTAKADADISES